MNSPAPRLRSGDEEFKKKWGFQPPDKLLCFPLFSPPNLGGGRGWFLSTCKYHACNLTSPFSPPRSLGEGKLFYFPFFISALKCLDFITCLTKQETPPNLPSADGEAPRAPPLEGLGRSCKFCFLVEWIKNQNNGPFLTKYPPYFIIRPHSW